MADSSTPVVSSSEANTPPSSAADQARIRKERREAKIRAGGSARLNKITGLGGGVQRDQPELPTTHADPEEVDISQHYYTPPSTDRSSRSNNNAPPSPSPQMTDDQLRQMMLGIPPSGTPPPLGSGPNPFAGFPGMDGAGGPPADDPMMKMLQQMMGSVPGEGAGGMPAFPGMPGQQAPLVEDPYAYVWRIVHASFSLGLGLYIASTTSFAGTRIERDRSGLSYLATDSFGGRDPSAFDPTQQGLSPASVHFFWIFATVEILLQTSRFFMEKGRVQGGGILGMIAGFLPEPYKGYVALVQRYGRIWTTVSADALVCVFVLGVVAWLRGA